MKNSLWKKSPFDENVNCGDWGTHVGHFGVNDSHDELGLEEGVGELRIL